MRVLVVDHETEHGASLASDLASQGHETAVAPDATEALTRIQSGEFDLVFADVKTPDFGGLELLRRIKSGSRPDTEVVLMSANGSIRAAVAAVKSGAFDFVAKPLTSAEIAALVTRMEQQRETALLRSVGVAAYAGDSSGMSELDRLIVGTSEGMARVKSMIKVSARTDANTLIYGETGVGKDLISSVIHRLSHRRKSPFVKVGCALFPESLIESELYGHEEGSFTGADAPRKGRFELAEGGTIYLDDVDDIPLAQQAKLLRAIEEKIFERVGGTKSLKADVRIVASSKKNLLAKIGEGTFRSDLYYRLDVLRIRVPPLRERRQDVPALVDHLLRRIAGEEPYRIDPQAVVLLAQHDWPGNVREMYHTLERAYLISGGHITTDLIETEMGSPAAPEGTVLPGHAVTGGFQAVMQHAEKQLLLSALEAAGGNKSAAAQALGLKASTFRDRLNKHGLG
jgi:DNA-binding NtrC family response regulator